MFKAPLNLNRHVPHQAIVRTLAPGVNSSVLPYLIACPICGKRAPGAPTMRVMPDPRTAGGACYYCSDCKKGWDSIELFADVRTANDAYEGLLQMRSDGTMGISSASASEADIREYVEHVYTPIHLAQLWWEQARARLLKRGSGHIAVMNQTGLDELYRYVTSAAPDAVARSVGQWVGLSNPVTSNVVSDKTIGLRSRAAFIAFGWNDAPGRVKAFTVFGADNHARLVYPRGFPKENPGLFMLDTAIHNDDVVYALNCPWVALWLQLKHLRYDSRKPLPMVAWHPDTTAETWQLVNAKRVIFWDYAPTLEIFVQARRVPDGWVTFSPTTAPYSDRINGTRWYLPPHKWLTGRQDGYAGVLNSMIAKAEPWPKALARWLGTLDGERIMGVTASLQLSGSDIARVLEEAPNDALRDRLHDAFSLTDIKQQSVVTNRRIIQVMDPGSCAWMLEHSNGHQELLSDVIVRLEKTVYFPNTKETMVYGILLHAGKQYRLIAPLSDMTGSRLPHVIIDAILKQGGKLPDISMANVRLLWDVIRRMSPTPRAETAVCRVGWNTDRTRYDLPYVSVENGQISEQACLLIDRSGDDRLMPGYALHSNAVHPIEYILDWLEPTDENATTWAIMAAVLANVLAPVEERPTTGIGLVGQTAEVIGETVARALGMIHLLSGETNLSDKIMARELEHDLPLHIVHDGKLPLSLVRWFNSTEFKNSMVALSPVQAEALAACGNWVFIHAPRAPTTIPAGVEHIFLGYIAAYQREQSAMRGIRGDAAAVLRGLRQWALTLADRDNDTTVVFSYAANMLKMSTGGETPAALFINMLLQLQQDSVIDFNYGADPGPLVTIQPGTHTVYVNVTRLMTALRRKFLPEPDLMRIQQSLETSGILLRVDRKNAGCIWKLDQHGWEEQSRIWTAAKGLFKQAETT